MTAPAPKPHHWPLSELAQRSPIPEQFQAARRWDPFWRPDATWGRQWVFDDRRAAQARYERAGRSGRSRELRVPVSEARARVLQDPRCLWALGAVMQWGHLTSEQVAAFAGFDPPPLGAPWRQEPRELRALWSARLVAVGELSDDGPYAPRVWRVLADDGFSDELSVEGRYAVHGGQGWSMAPAGVDHALVSAEHGLRMAEAGNVQAVLGETMSTHTQLFGTKTPASCDLAVIEQQTGARIAFEVTRSRSRADVRRKLARLTKSMMTGEQGTSPVAVCFLAATTPKSPRGSVASTIRDEIAEAVRTTLGAAHHQLRERIFTVTWEALYPRPGFFDDRGVELLARRYGESRCWRTASMLDAPLAVPDPVEVERAIAATRVLGGTPCWIRDALIAQHGRPDAEALYRSAAGLEDLLEHHAR